MYLKSIFCLIFIACKVFGFIMPNPLESEQTSFFGFTHEVRISSSTMELVEELEEAVLEQSEGDRQVRRYFDTYDTPFFGEERRKSSFNYD